MAANNRGVMRPNGRSPPFLAIGLGVALVILGFNYWNLSSKNGEQANELAVMESEMRLTNAKKISAEKRGEAITDKVKDLESQLNQQRTELADKVAALTAKESDLLNLRTARDNCDAEIANVRSSLQQCEDKESAANSELENVKGQLENLKGAADTKQCDSECCKDLISAARNQLLDEIVKTNGPAVLQSMHRAGYNVGKYQDQMGPMIDAAAGVQVQQPQLQGLPQQQQVQQQQPEQPQVGQQQPDQPLVGQQQPGQQQFQQQQVGQQEQLQAAQQQQEQVAQQQPGQQPDGIVDTAKQSQQQLAQDNGAQPAPGDEGAKSQTGNSNAAKVETVKNPDTPGEKELESNRMGDIIANNGLPRADTNVDGQLKEREYDDGDEEEEDDFQHNAGLAAGNEEDPKKDLEVRVQDDAIDEMQQGMQQGNMQ